MKHADSRLISIGAPYRKHRYAFRLGCEDEPRLGAAAQVRFSAASVRCPIRRHSFGSKKPVELTAMIFLERGRLCRRRDKDRQYALRSHASIIGQEVPPRINPMPMESNFLVAVKPCRWHAAATCGKHRGRLSVTLSGNQRHIPRRSETPTSPHVYCKFIGSSSISRVELNLQFDDLPGALVVYDADGTLIKANQGALNLLGADAEELIGSRAALAGWLVTDVAGWPDAENLHPAIAAIRSQHAQREVVARVIRPDGAEVWIQIDAGPVTTSTGSVSHVVATLTDLTRVFQDARLPRSGYGDHALAAITDQLAGSRLDPAAILQAVTSTLSKLRSGTWMAALMNKDPGTLRIVAANDADPEVAAYIENIQLRPNAPTFTISSRVIDSGEPVLIPNVSYDEFIGLLNTDIRDYVEKNAPPISFPAPHLGVLVVPMRARGAVVGTLGLFEPRGSKPLTERDVRWAQAIADRTGLATDNAQLYVDAVTRLERLTALRSVGLAMSGSNDLRLTLQVILDQAVAGLGVDAADILLLNEKDGLLGLMASTGFHSTSLPDYRLPVDDKLPGRAFFSSRT